MGMDVEDERKVGKAYRVRGNTCFCAANCRDFRSALHWHLKQTVMALKRKPPPDESDAESSSQGFDGLSEDEVDISNALSGKRLNTAVEGSDGDFEELEKLIKDSVAARDKKEGTKLLKQTKGKAKIAKGEVGGGSFQSMGEFFVVPSIVHY